MSALFGHKKGAFTGAATDRAGLLMEADGGLLFLDEIGELGLDEQAMLLKAIEDKRFMPFGSDKESSSDFQVIAGTNKDLLKLANKGLFRDDLLARIDLWTYQLPSLNERLEDLAPNIDYELEAFSNRSGNLISFNKVAREKYLKFGMSAEATWSANFRDLNASITRMGTLSDGGRITTAVVDDEISRLKRKWKTISQNSWTPSAIIDSVLGTDSSKSIDYYEQLKLANLIQVCQNSRSMADAGRKLFNISRKTKKSNNDSHRVKQLLEKYKISFEDISAVTR